MSKECPLCGTTADPVGRDRYRCSYGHIIPTRMFYVGEIHGPPAPPPPSRFQTMYDRWQWYRGNIVTQTFKMGPEFVEFLDSVFDAWEIDADLVEQEFG